MGPFRGGPQSWLETPLPTHHPPLLFSSDVSVLYQLGFHIPVFVQLCRPLWNLVHCGLCANVLQRTVLNSNYACVQPPLTHPHTHTERHTHTGGSDGGQKGVGQHGGCMCGSV